jgi:phosphoglycerate dehydrogenase-like enzyme
MKIMEQIHVLTTVNFTQELLDGLRAVSPRYDITQETCHNADEVATALEHHPNTEILYAFQVPAELLTVAPRLRWLQLHSAGADHLLDHALMDSDVAVTTVSGIHATPIAEYAFASMLAHRWRIPHMTHCQRAGEWPSGRWKLYARPELRGSTLGIVGYGSIGREVGRLGQAFGMHVLALRHSPGRADEGYTPVDTGDPQGLVPDRMYLSEELDEMLAQCDYVVVALPMTPETRHFIGEAELRTMKPTAYLVNIARGAIVDEEALIRALQNGWIGGAGLDVFEQEPLPAESPLWDLENVLISPHVAGFSPHYDERAAELFGKNLARYLNDQPLLNLMDKARGY